MATYKDELIKSMEYLGSKDDVMFIGQQIVFRGNPMSTTIETFPKEKMIETMSDEITNLKGNKKKRSKDK